MPDKPEQISFDLPKEHAEAIRALAGERKARIAGEVREGRLVVDAVSFAREDFSKSIFVPVNAPFMTARDAAA
jgi:hypothetical protein